MNATSFNFARDQLFNDLQLACLQGSGELYIFQDREDGALHFLSDDDDFRERMRNLESNGVHFSRAFSIDPEVLEAYGFRAGVLMVFDIDSDELRPDDVFTSGYVSRYFDYERLPDQFVVAKVML